MDLNFGRVHCENASDVRVRAALSDDLTELLKADFAVAVLVQVQDGLVHDLLELGVRQVLARHHLEDLKQLSVGNEAIAVHVVDPENELQFLVPLMVADSDLC